MRHLPPPLALGLLCAFAVVPGLAQVRGRPDAMGEWNARMNGLAVQAKAAGSAAEREGLVRQMEALLQACGANRGCQVVQLLPAYKLAVSAAGPVVADVNDDDDGPDEMIDAPGEAGTRAPGASQLLDERNRRFLQMVKMNPAVQAGIRKWLTDMRPSLMASFENFQYLKSQMSSSFQRPGLSEALLFGIVAKESNGKVHVGSRVGAVGPLQFMPATGRRFGLGPDGTGFDTRYDPQLSANAAAEYLQERYAELGNSVEMALAAYNGGEGRALRIYQSTGGRDFWDPSVYSQFPEETRDYVPMVIAAAWLYLHPRDYGVRFPRVTDTPTTFRLQRPASFNELTICMGNARGTDGYLRALRNMNPRYSPSQWLAAGTTLNGTTAMARAYSWNCTSGRRAELARELMIADARSAVVRVGSFETIDSDRPADPGRDPAQHVQAPVGVRPAQPGLAMAGGTPAGFERVRPGERLDDVAARTGCPAETLARANALRAPGFEVSTGQLLRLDGCPRR